ncbi:MAG: MbnP family protein [Chitinophagaceae bacterium]
MESRSRYYPYFLSVTFFSVVTMLLAASGPRDARTNPANAAVSLEFIHKVGSKELFTDSSYQNNFGESYTISRFRYYISNIQWHNHHTGSLYKMPPRSFLIDEAVPESKQIALVIPPGQYTSLSFLIGVDSLKNVSGAQDGTLDPINGMFWTWQTGYIMAKLEGSSPVSSLPRKMFEFHIGGFKGPYNVVRRVEIPLKKNLLISKEKKQAPISIVVDINKWFDGKHPLPLSAYTACMTPGKLSLQYAENYFTMFSTEDPR